jgi:pyruvate formate lyase activating enzyme
MIKIGGLQKTTLIDFPGQIAATVFLVGCNFRCPWCYSSELVLPEKIKKQPLISQKYFFDFLKERKNLLGGVVICGGEPTLRRDLPSFIKKIKKMGFLVKLDTNGSNPDLLKKLIKQKLVDYIAMDIKGPLVSQGSETALGRIIGGSKNQKYNQLTGVKVDLNKIKKSIEIIKNSGLDYEFRTTFVPFLLTKEDILQIAREISPAKKYFLQNFLPEKTNNPALAKIKAYHRDYLLEIQKSISPFFETCLVR